MINRPLLIVLVGLPASGKSTFRNRVRTTHSDHEFVELSSDDYIEKMALAQGSTYNNVFEATVGQASSYLETEAKKARDTRANVIWDQTNLSVKKRKKVLDKFPNYVKICIDFPLPDEADWYKRLYQRAGRENKFIPIGILAQMRTTYERPSIEEGFDLVLFDPEDFFRE